MAARYHEPVPLGRWQRRSRRYRWMRWLKQRGAVVAHEVIPEDRVHQYMDAADAVVIPRTNALSSGIVGLAMTFGKVLIAPNHGAFPEYLAGTENLLYRSGDSRSLAEAIMTATTLDPIQVSAANLRLAEGRTIDRTVAAALDATGVAAGP